jgi:hypothetical protein
MTHLLFKLMHSVSLWPGWFYSQGAQSRSASTSPPCGSHKKQPDGSPAGPRSLRNYLRTLQPATESENRQRHSISHSFCHLAAGGDTRAGVEAARVPVPPRNSREIFLLKSSKIRGKFHTSFYRNLGVSKNTRSGRRLRRHRTQRG